MEWWAAEADTELAAEATLATNGGGMAAQTTITQRRRGQAISTKTRGLPIGKEKRISRTYR